MTVLKEIVFGLGIQEGPVYPFGEVGVFPAEWIKAIIHHSALYCTKNVLLLMEMGADGVVDDVGVDQEVAWILESELDKIDDCLGMYVDNVVIEADVDGLGVGAPPEERIDRVSGERSDGYLRLFERDVVWMRGGKGSHVVQVIVVCGVEPQPPLIYRVFIPEHIRGKDF